MLLTGLSVQAWTYLLTRATLHDLLLERKTGIATLKCKLARLKTNVAADASQTCKWPSHMTQLLVKVAFCKHHIDNKQGASMAVCLVVVPT